ncbi:tetratricopeptide repeat protein [Owenweeksia hongkongensis]|uniref:tetratricopeptide repeat protein n=1 Tax=Owenweeksia hongkongensis TaxID=253245 RepID=UPI003A959097
MLNFYSTIQAKFLLILVPLLIYGATTSYDFAVDDHGIINDHAHVLAGVDGIDEIFTTNYRNGILQFNDGLYRPLSLAIFATFEEIAPGSPMPGHFLNIALCALITVLIFFLVKEFPVKDPKKTAFWTALFFAIMPVHTEVVANIKSLDELLSITFALTTCISILSYLKNRNVAFIGLAALTFFLALLSKESSLTYLAIIPLIIYVFFPSTSLKSSAVLMFPLATIAGIWLYIRHTVLSNMPALDPEVFGMLNNPLTIINNYPDQLASALNVQLTGLYKLFVPYPLLHDYSYDYFPVVKMASMYGAFLLALFIALAGITVWGVYRRKYWAFGLAFYGITISPVANIIFQNSTIFGERLLFTPSLGIAFTIVILASKIKAPKALIWGPVILSFVYGFLSFDRQQYWKNNDTLFAQDITHLENSARGNYNYATSLYKKYKDIDRSEAYKDEALIYFDRAISIYPDYLDAWNNKGSLHIFAKEYSLAEKSFLKVIEIQPLYGKAYFNLAVVYQETEKYALAAEYYQKAIDHNISNADAYYGLGYNLGFINKMDEAKAAFEKTIKLDANYSKAYVQLGKIYGQSGQAEKSINAFKKSIALNPNDAESHFYLGITYLNAGNKVEGQKSIEVAYRLDPNFNNVGQILQQLKAQ